MASQDKIRSDIKSVLPGAEDVLVDHLVAKVEEELNNCRLRKVGRRRQKVAVDRVINQEELAALGLR